MAGPRHTLTLKSKGQMTQIPFAWLHVDTNAYFSSCLVSSEPKHKLQCNHHSDEFICKM